YSTIGPYVIAVKNTAISPMNVPTTRIVIQCGASHALRRSTIRADLCGATAQSQGGGCGRRACGRRLFYGPLPLVARPCRRQNSTQARHVSNRHRPSSLSDLEGCSDPSDFLRVVKAGIAPGYGAHRSSV